MGVTKASPLVPFISLANRLPFFTDKKMSAQGDHIKHTESVVSDVQKPEDTEAAEMDVERRKTIEKSLVRKLDLRCSLFILLYIMSEFPGSVSRDRGPAC